MDKTKAKSILKRFLGEDDNLIGGYEYICWPKNGNVKRITLDGTFYLDEMEALVWWMKNETKTSTS